MVNAVPEANAVPPVETLYHCMAVPVAVKLATVGLLPVQNACVTLPVGATGVVFTVAVTSRRVVDSQPDEV